MKFNSTGNNGVPDRICLLNGNVIFVELKRPVGGVVRPDQVAMQASMRTRGATVLNINSKQQCDELIAMMKERAGHGGW